MLIYQQLQMDEEIRRAKFERRNKYRIPEPPPALVFYNTKFSLHNLIKIGVKNGLFTDDEADNNNQYAIDEVKKFFENNIRKNLEEGNYDSVTFLTGEELTDENIAKYKQLYLS